MTLNDLERQNMGFLWIFWPFWSVRVYHSQGGATPVTPHAPMADV